MKTSSRRIPPDFLAEETPKIRALPHGDSWGITQSVDQSDWRNRRVGIAGQSGCSRRIGAGALRHSGAFQFFHTSSPSFASAIHCLPLLEHLGGGPAGGVSSLSSRLVASASRLSAERPLQKARSIVPKSPKGRCPPSRAVGKMIALFLPRASAILCCLPPSRAPASAARPRGGSG
jgi:hypothetical protein